MNKHCGCPTCRRARILAEHLTFLSIMERSFQPASTSQGFVRNVPAAQRPGEQS